MPSSIVDGQLQSRMYLPNRYDQLEKLNEPCTDRSTAILYIRNLEIKQRFEFIVVLT